MEEIRKKRVKCE